jgi:WD40 repeat protein
LFRDLRARPATRDLAERFARVCQSGYALVPAVGDFLQVQAKASTSTGTRGSPAAAAGPAASTLRVGDVVTLNRLYSPARARPRRRSWSMRRAAAQVALTFTPDGALLATAESTRKVRLRETGSGRVLHVWTTPTQITLMTCSADGRQIFGSGPDGRLSVWPLTARGVAQHLVTPAGNVRGLACGPGGPLVAVAAGRTLHLVEAATGQRLSLNAGRGEVACVAFSRDAGVVAAGSTDGAWRCWSTRGGALLAANRQPARVCCLGVSADGRTLATGGPTGAIRVWAIPGGQLLTDVQLPDAEPVVRIAFARDQTRLAAAGASGRIVVCDLLTGPGMVHTLAGPPGRISDLAFSPDGRLLAATSVSGCVWVRALPASRPSIAPPRPAPRGVPKRVTPIGQTAGQWLIDMLRRVGAAAWAP